MRIPRPCRAISMAVPILCVGAAACDDGAGEAAADPCAGKLGPTGRFEKTLWFDGLERTYRLAVPASYDNARPEALVLNFHRLARDAEHQETASRAAEKAEAAGFLTAAPDGVGGSWNGTICCAPANRDGVDDVGFVRALVDSIAESYCVDPKRVYAMGLSNGAVLSNRLACDASDLIAAIGPIAGTNLGLACPLTRPVPVMGFHATTDPEVPYALGEMAFERWGEQNGCTGEPETVIESGATRCRRFPECRDGATTALCTVEGAGHQWPGGNDPDFEIEEFGLSATDALWEFFAAHPMP